MGWGCNQRCFDLCFQLLSKLNRQFDVCSPASSVCGGQHDRAVVSQVEAGLKEFIGEAETRLEKLESKRLRPLQDEPRGG
jgi:hypothetical protein